MKIMFEDKVALNENPSIADINKVNASDMNEIKTVVNANDDYVNGLFNLIYPVGAVYMSVNNTNPSTLFGGTWQQIKDVFLLSAGDTYTAGNTGGNMPQLVDDLGLTAGSFGGITSGGDYSKRIVASSSSITNEQAYWNKFTNYNYDGLPPYLVVYMWKRTA